MVKSKLRIFPSERMSAGFPWQIWAVGWLCIFKGIIWLAYEPEVDFHDGLRRSIEYYRTILGR